MRWGEATNFSKLRSLTVHSPIDVEALRWLTTHCRLSSLDNLALNVDCPDRDVPDEDISNAMDDLLRSLRPLKSLKIVGLIQPRSISLTTEHHGRYLRRLLLSSTESLSEHHMEQGRADFATVPFLHELKENCPRLKELALRMIRSKGDANEVAIYRAIGKISSLRKIHLSVLCSEPLTWDTTVYEQFEAAYDDSTDLDQEMKHRLDDALMNSAMDETLARSIFQVMSKAKPLYAPPLECLELRMNVLREWPTISSHKLLEFLRYIARSWICNRGLHDDGPHQCSVRVYDKKEELDRQESERYDELPNMNDLHYAQALCRVWPKCKEREWTKEWHSFPLSDT